MTFEQTMTALERAGTAQNRKIYARHGMAEPMFGVSFATLGKLTRQIKCDHTLSLALWESGNTDARMLATMIADPRRLTAKILSAWAKDLNSSALADALGKLAMKTPHAEPMMHKWMNSRNALIEQAGWVLVALHAMHSELPDSFFIDMIQTIEQEIHGARNQVKYAMNNALIAIGGRGDALTHRAIQAARRIGKVEVDHGQTSCKTPDAETYIEKMLTHQSGRTRAKRVK